VLCRVRGRAVSEGGYGTRELHGIYERGKCVRYMQGVVQTAVRFNEQCVRTLALEMV
jgi:hypothetical protein